MRLLNKGRPPTLRNDLVNDAALRRRSANAIC